jgi:anti-sigma factor RsiW
MTNEHAIMQDRLDDYVDGALAPQDRLELEAHLQGCEVCRAEVAAQRLLGAEVDRLPREIAPPRDLWAGIAARIEGAPRRGATPVEEAPAIDLAARRRISLPWWSGIAAVAASVLLVALSAGLTMFLTRGPGGGAVVATLPAEQVVAGERPTTALAAFRPTEREVGGTLETLAAEFAARRHLLAPETVATLEESLRVIDAAIAEATAALEADPSNADLPLLLSGVYRSKMELLQTAVDLSARS